MMLILGAFSYLSGLVQSYLGAKMHYVLQVYNIWMLVILYMCKLGSILVYMDLKEGWCNICWPNTLPSALST